MFFINCLASYITYESIISIPTNYYFINGLYHNIMMTCISTALVVWGGVFIHDMLAYGDVMSFHDIITSDRRYDISYFPYFQAFIVVSKIMEWIDTLLLKQNNKKIGTLHHFHHLTIVSAFYYGCYIPGFVVTGMLNSSIHILMYLYYFKPSKQIAKFLTMGQIVQLIGNTIFNFYGIFYETPLHNHHPVTIYSTYCGLCTTGYLILFIDFYMKRYKIKYHNWGLHQDNVTSTTYTLSHHTVHCYP